jgi:hypothetical protein
MIALLLRGTQRGYVALFFCSVFLAHGFAQTKPNSDRAIPGTGQTIGDLTAAGWPTPIFKRVFCAKRPQYSQGL